MISHGITMITAMHWQVSAEFMDFFSMPEKFASKIAIIDGSYVDTPQAAILAAAIAAVTGIPGIPLCDGNWWRNEAGETFLLDLRNLVEQPCQATYHCFNPELLELSVSK